MILLLRSLAIAYNVRKEILPAARALKKSRLKIIFFSTSLISMKKRLAQELQRMTKWKNKFASFYDFNKFMLLCHRNKMTESRQKVFIS
jgi:hypothetical protein